MTVLDHAPALRERAARDRQRAYQIQLDRTERAAKKLVKRFDDLPFEDWQRRDLHRYMFSLLHEFTASDTLKKVQDALLGAEK